MYSIIAFDNDSVALCSTSWIRAPKEDLSKGLNVELLFPKKFSASNVLARTHTPMTPNNATLESGKILGMYDDYDLARKLKLPKAEETSNLDDSDFEPKRTVKKPERYKDAEEGSDSEELSPAPKFKKQNTSTPHKREKVPSTTTTSSPRRRCLPNAIAQKVRRSPRVAAMLNTEVRRDLHSQLRPVVIFESQHSQPLHQLEEMEGDTQASFLFNNNNNNYTMKKKKNKKINEKTKGTK
uniref:Uncharacterized protein n=1 Tax=Cacopsylla melanoneura TaxID=428564 RepID=A0A8D8QKQ1_9HEMI